MTGLPIAARIDLIRDRLELSRRLRVRGDLEAAADQLVGAVDDLAGVVGDIAERS